MIVPLYATQYDGSSGRQDVTIVVGLDWGTSATKVIFREPYGINSPAFLIDFGGIGYPGNSFLLPSRLFVDQSGFVSLAPGRDSKAVDDLKLRLMADDPEDVVATLQEGTVSAAEAAALYVACVLRNARSWFLKQHAEKYRQYRIDWSLNLGIPVSTLDEAPKRHLFHTVAAVGWWLSTSRCPLTVNLARKGLELANEDKLDDGLPDYAINVVPEVVAQVSGYARSTARNNGLHVLLDVGAATVDIAGFILFDREGEDRYSLLCARVEEIGAYKLHEKRVDAVSAESKWKARLSRSEISEWLLTLEKTCTPMTGVPAKMSEYYPPAVRAKLSAPGQPDETFKRLCRQCIEYVLGELRVNRYPRAPAWQNGLPFFVAGGGQSVNPYARAVASAKFDWMDHRQCAPFNLSSLPAPSNLDAKTFRGEDYHRISVAYGLSYPFDDIGGMLLPSEIADVPREEPLSEGATYEDT
jgi:hypothetical protein